jgi:cysteine sulfinate desulfinase/cysteine desulfurase-like protein
MGVMSPDAGKQEQIGMVESAEFFAHRPSMSPRLVMMFGDTVYNRRENTQHHNHGVGFKRAAYIIAANRKLKDEPKKLCK